MNRKGFLEELYMALSRLPEEERRNAMTYYNEYLDEAGEENEEAALASLGSAKEIAARINAEFAIKDMEEHPKSASKGITAILVVLLAIFASPIAVPLALCILLGAFCIIMLVVGILLSLWGVAVTCVAGGLVCVVAAPFITDPVGAGVIVSLIGGGIATTGFGLLFGVFCFWVTKWSFRGIAYLFNKTLKRHRRKTPQSDTYEAPPTENISEEGGKEDE